MDKKEIKKLTRRILERRPEFLAPREVMILSFRFGFFDGKEHTLEEAGQEFGVTRERIRQIEAGALKKIKVAAVERKSARLKSKTQ